MIGKSRAREIRGRISHPAGPEEAVAGGKRPARGDGGGVASLDAGGTNVTGGALGARVGERMGRSGKGLFEARGIRVRGRMKIRGCHAGEPFGIVA